MSTVRVTLQNGVTLDIRNTIDEVTIIASGNVNLLNMNTDFGDGSNVKTEMILDVMPERNSFDTFDQVGELKAEVIK